MYEEILNYLIDMAINLAVCMFYPFLCGAQIIIDLVLLVWTTFWNLFTAIYSLCSSIYNMFYSFVYLIFPNTWIFLICLGILIVLIMRIYSILKDTEIAGFKI